MKYVGGVRHVENVSVHVVVDASLHDLVAGQYSIIYM